MSELLDAGTIYERYAPQIRRYLLSRCGDADLADDLLSETFERVVAGLASYDDRGWPVSAWIYRIATARLIDHRRQARRRPRVPIEGWHAHVDGPEDAVARAVMQDWVRDAIRARLSGDQRTVVWLRFVCDLSLEEIAGRLGMTEGAAKQLQLRAIANLRRVFVWDDDMTPMMVAWDRAVRRQAERPRRDVATCARGCDRVVYVKDICRRCYNREYRVQRASASAPPDARRTPPVPCAAEGCGARRCYADGYCHKHHNRLVRTGTIADPIYNHDRTCRECDRPVHAAGLCPMHYQRARRESASRPSGSSTRPNSASSDQIASIRSQA